MAKVKVSFTLDVDLDAWASEYALEKSEVRADIQDYAKTVIREYFSVRGLLIEGA